MEILYILLILLLLTRTFGEIAERLGQPALVGELISGIVLGLLVQRYSDALPLLSGLKDDEVFIALTDLGIFFLMLLGGVHMQPSELAKASGPALLVAIGGMAIPFGLGMGLGYWFLPASGVRFAQSFFLGVALAVTAVPVAVKILHDLGALQSKLGRVVVSAAVVDDILSLILLASLSALVETQSLPGAGDILMLCGKVLLFFAITGPIGWWLFPYLGRVLKRARLDEFEFSGLILAGLGYAALAEVLGMHFIIGAFVAGLFFGRRSIDDATYDHVRQRVSGLTLGLLAPIFFASIGLHMNVGVFTEIPLFVTLLIVAAVAGKLVGTAVPARLAGLDNRESLTVGFAMSARGAVELVIADIALRAGLFEEPTPVPPIVGEMFSAVVVMAIVTTLLTPVTLRLSLGKRGESSEDDGA